MAYVHKILQETIEVEHSTIPLYLTSLFSIVNSSNFAGATLHSVVIEEMLHMTTACNMLNAMGGAPAIDSPVFIPVYPLRLPMINVTADIRRFDAASVANFMLIESTTALSKSIAACYEYVLSIVQKLSEEYGEPAVFTGNYSYQVQAKRTKTVLLCCLVRSVVPPREPPTRTPPFGSFASGRAELCAMLECFSHAPEQGALSRATGRLLDLVGHSAAKVTARRAAPPPSGQREAKLVEACSSTALCSP